MLADATIPDSYKYGTRLNEAFLAGVEYAERILTENVMALWLARNKSCKTSERGDVIISTEPPYWGYNPVNDDFTWVAPYNSESAMFEDSKLFPELTFENSPLKVELRIVEDEQD